MSQNEIVINNVMWNFGWAGENLYCEGVFLHLWVNGEPLWNLFLDQPCYSSSLFPPLSGPSVSQESLGGASTHLFGSCPGFLTTQGHL